MSHINTQCEPSATSTNNVNHEPHQHTMRTISHITQCEPSATSTHNVNHQPHQHTM
ncbi:hypothetical protein DPMN_167393 [Dreissena polymorpha]|uniref:Uncharacterized protein n=1 Tax=Dreissena polymorpha TaxID=45954 RepID=A0A9D4F0A5_DREPO|nr:hypothetical protein DPMN_167393 [Dreissena polymorpha]